MPLNEAEQVGWSEMAATEPGETASRIDRLILGHFEAKLEEEKITRREDDEARNGQIKEAWRKFSTTFKRRADGRTLTMMISFFISSVCLLVFALPPFRLLFKEEALKFRRKEARVSIGSGHDRFNWWKAAHLSFKLVIFLIFTQNLYRNLVANNAYKPINGPRYYSVAAEQANENAFYTNEPQPLVYNAFSHEPGSGEGPLNPINQLLVHSASVSSSSSSISPSLITAKCWNNYENDNDCKHINLITGSQSSNNNNELGHQEPNDDDSLITPVVIFEASSSLEPAMASSPSPVYLAPPYFSSTTQSNADNVVLARHRTPPTANERFAAPPAGATIIPAYALPGKDSDRNSVTWPSTSDFVATPAPKLKPPKTSTLGRKCRDENDADCDEPEEEEEGDAATNRKGKGDNDDDNEDDDADETTSESDTESDESRSGTSGRPKQSSGSTSYDRISEMGSGDGPRNDGDDDDDDGGADEGDDSTESSGGSEPPSLVGIEHTTRYVEVSSTTDRQLALGSSSNIEQPPPSVARNPVRAGAEIEVVVHPTLPPTFPITTTTTTTISTTSNLDEPSTTRDYFFDQSLSSSTIMPDDTFTSKPVFPPASGGAEQSSSNQSKGVSYDSAAEQSTETGDQAGGSKQVDQLDLATFRSIPMPAVESESMHPVNQAAGSNSSPDNNNSSESGGDNNKLDNKYKFKPSSFTAAPIKFDSPWRIPARPPSSSSQLNPSGGQATGEQPWQQQQRQRRPQESRILEANQSRAQADMLPALLLYAAILILILTTVIFAIMVALWRRNSAKRRALLQKSRLISNGTDQQAGPNQMMPGSVSQPSRLVANIQQPGLLSTYAPGKGMTMGKITTSIVNNPDELIGVEVDEDEDDQGRLLNDPNDEEQSANNSQQDGSSIENNKANNQQHQARTSSWSTEDHTTSSGSQKTDISQPRGIVGQPNPMTPNQQQQQHMQQSGNRPPYPSSLSDGRQNSSSISDSQGSPDIRDGLMMGAHPQQAGQYPAEPHQAYNGAQIHRHPPPVRYDGGALNYINQSPVIQEGCNKRLNLSRSVEDMQQAAGSIGMNEIQAPYMAGLVPAQARHQVALLHQQQMMNPLQQKPMFKHLNQTQDAQQAYLTNSRPLIQQQTIDGYLNGNINNNGLNHRYGPQPPMVVGEGRGQAEFQFSNVPLDPARIALNPLATLSRRYQPGLSLNRSIYSEDSSSLMTASPSLVRTSSSSSFAFNGSQASSIRAKPLVDAAGRVFNDYTQAGYTNGDGNPPISERKSRNEAWYV